MTLSHYLRPHRLSLLPPLFFVCRVWCLVDFRFLASAALSIAAFASSFLTTVGCTLLIASTPFVFAVSTPSLFVAWSIDAFSLFTASSIFAFAVAFSSSVAFGVWSISAFLASAALSIVAFASSFLTTVGWILLIESKPFDFAVSTPALFVAWSIAFLVVVTASSTFAFAAFLRLSRLVFGRFPLS